MPPTSAFSPPFRSFFFFLQAEAEALKADAGAVIEQSAAKSRAATTITAFLGPMFLKVSVFLAEKANAAKAGKEAKGKK